SVPTKAVKNHSDIAPLTGRDRDAATSYTPATPDGVAESGFVERPNFRPQPKPPFPNTLSDIGLKRLSQIARLSCLYEVISVVKMRTRWICGSSRSARFVDGD